MSAELVVGVSARELVPGDPDEVERLAARLSAFSGGMVDAAERLGSIQADDWKGPAGDAFRALIGEQPTKYDTAASAFSHSRYAQVLREAQADAQRAVQLHEQAHRQTQGWKREWDRYDADVRTAAAAGAAPSAPRPAATDPGAGDRALARQVLGDARLAVHTQAVTAASVLSAAEEGAPKAPGLLDSIVGGAGDVFGDVRGMATGGWNATAAFLDDAGAWVKDTWEATGDDLLRMGAGLAKVIEGAGAVVVGTGAVTVALGGEVVGVSLDATGVGAVVGVPINIGAAALGTIGVVTTLGGAALVNQGFSELSQGFSGLTVHMAKKKDIRQVDDVARKHQIKDRSGFGKWIEKEKKHDPGSANARGDYTRKELEEKAAEYKDKRGGKG